MNSSNKHETLEIEALSYSIFEELSDSDMMAFAGGAGTGATGGADSAASSIAAMQAMQQKAVEQNAIMASLSAQQAKANDTAKATSAVKQRA